MRKSMAARLLCMILVCSMASAWIPAQALADGFHALTAGAPATAAVAAASTAPAPGEFILPQTPIGPDAFPPDAFYVRTEEELRYALSGELPPSEWVWESIPEHPEGGRWREFQPWSDGWQGAYVVLADNIFLSGEWTPATNFTGTLDGWWHNIFNLRTADDIQNAGLFGSITQPIVIQNLGVHLLDMRLFSSDTSGLLSFYAGGLVGSIWGDGSLSVDNCFVLGDITVDTSSSASVGGLVGSDSRDTTITNSYADISLSARGGDLRAGGLVGTSNAALSNCFVTGSVYGEGSFTSVGGMIGMSSDAIVEDCYTSAEVTGFYPSGPASSCQVAAGGLIGHNYNSDVVRCWATGSVSAATATSTGLALAGGLVGRVYHFWDVSRDCGPSNSYATGDVSATAVGGEAYAGGLVGQGLYPIIDHCYATGRVTAEADPGSTAVARGILGNNMGDTNSNYRIGSVSFCYYDQDTTGCTDTGRGEPKTNAEMKQSGTYEEFDFETVWDIDPAVNGGYPHLRAQAGSGSPSGIIDVSLGDATLYLGYRMSLFGYSLFDAGAPVMREQTISESSFSFQNLPLDYRYELSVYSPNGFHFGMSNIITLTSESPHDLAFFSLSVPKTLSLTLLTPELVPLTSGYTVSWYSGSYKLPYGGTGLPSGYALRYEVTLGAELAASYEPPAPGTVTVSANDAENQLQVTLIKSQHVTLRGQISDANGPLSGVTLMVTPQTGTSSPVTVVTDGAGCYTITTLPGRLRIQAAKYGYLDFEWYMTMPERDAALDITLQKADGVQLDLAITRVSSCLPGDTPDTAPLRSAQGLRVSLRNLTQGRDVSPLQSSALSFLLAEADAQPGDVILVAVADLSGGAIDAVAEVTVHSGTNTVALTLTENGTWQALDYTSGNGSDMALVFDQAGKHRATVYASRQGLRGGTLPEGMYTIVFLGENLLIRQPIHLSDLSLVGLADAVDFAAKTVSIQPGIITNVEQLDIPQLDWSKFACTIPEATSFTLNKTQVAAGAAVTARLAYAFAPQYADMAAEFVIEIALPDGCELVAGSATLDNQPINFTVDGNRALLRTNKPEGILRFSTVMKTAGSHMLSAFVRISDGAGDLTRLMGAAAVTVEQTKLSVPKETSTPEFVVSGITEPRGTVTVLRNGVAAGTATANAAGSWRLTVDLGETFFPSYHEISARIVLPGNGVTVDSESYALLYSPVFVSVSKVTFINQIHEGPAETVVDFSGTDTVIPYYYFWPNYPTFTFLVEFDDPDVPLSDVAVLTENRYGTISWIPLTYDADKKLWVGTYNFTNETLPVKLDVSFVCEAVPAIDPQLLSDWEQEYWAILDEIQNRPIDLDFDLDAFHEYADSVTVETFCLDLESELAESDMRADDLLSYGSNFLTEMGYAVDSSEEGVLRIADDAFGGTLQSGSSDAYDEESILSQGFSAMPRANGTFIYVRVEGTHVTIVDFGLGTAITFEIVETAAEPASGAPFSTQTLATQALDALASGSSDFKYLESSLNRCVTMLQKLADLVNKVAEKAAGNVGALEHQLDTLQRENALVQTKFNEYSTRYLNPTAADRIRLNQMKTRLGALAVKTSRCQGLLTAMRMVAKAAAAVKGAGIIFTAISYVQNARELFAIRDSIPGTCSGSCGHTNCSCAAALSSILEDMEWTALKMTGYYGGAFLLSVVSIIALLSGGLSLALPTGGVSLLALLGVLLVIGAQIGIDVAFQSWQHNKFEHYKAFDFKLLKSGCALCCGWDDTSGSSASSGSGLGGSARPIRAILDPSGFVYEAVPSNRLPGVKTTVWFADDNTGTNAALWDAADYDQNNPLYTNAAGLYAWDVPFGWWQVVSEKDGYESAYSAWLPVPPPQLEVNLGMVSRAAPVVTYASGYPAFLEIGFDKYMDTGTLTADTITLAGYDGSYTIVFPDAEPDPQHPETLFARTARILPDGAPFPLGGTVTLTADTTAKSYAGVGLEGAYQAAITVTQQPTDLVPSAPVTLPYGQTRTVTVSVLPAQAGAGQRISAFSTSPLIATLGEAEAVTDDSGVAVFPVTGSLSGAAELVFRLENTQLTGTMTVTVSLPGQTPPTQTYTVTFDPNGATHTGGGALTQTVSSGDAAVAPTLTRSGYTFDGWNKAFDSVTADMTVTAQWIRNSSPTSPPFEPDPDPVPSPPEAWNNPYADISDADWFYEAVRFVSQRGLMNGTGMDNFSPAVPTSRAMLVTVLYRLEGQPAAGAPLPFPDVGSGMWYSGSIAWAAQNGIVTGYDNGNFGPDDLVTREQAVAIVYRYAAYQGADVGALADLSSFADADQISDWALIPMRWAVATGVIRGTGTGISPADIMTRAEAAAILQRIPAPEA